MNDDPISQLLLRGGAYAIEHLDAELRKIENPTPTDKEKLRLYLSAKAMFPQLSADDLQILVDLKFHANPYMHGLWEKLPEDARDTAQAERIKQWEDARERFNDAQIAAKLDPVQVRCVEKIFLSTRQF